MKLNTRVFELCDGKYRNLVELAQTMEISQDLIYRVRKGERWEIMADASTEPIP